MAHLVPVASACITSSPETAAQCVPLSPYPAATLPPRPELEVRMLPLPTTMGTTYIGNGTSVSTQSHGRSNDNGSGLFDHLSFEGLHSHLS